MANGIILRQVTFFGKIEAQTIVAYIEQGMIKALVENWDLPVKPETTPKKM